ncbi:Protein transport protein SFT2 [Smittium mucronatum]|uniref:Protein transport protein SFT2 n=1 Tax=Smittium mucronatum TaxID=133383 RepID=A0A1R0H822_9FUNG|nr:Protein transport protein SFT2 [Smittium mucronatum]
MSSLMQGLGSLKTSQGRYTPSGSGDQSTSESAGFFSSIADGAASLANSARTRVENFSLTGNSDPNNIQNQPEWFGLTTFQRWAGGIGFGLMAVFCLMMSLMSLPFIVITPSKFATSFSMGNLMIILAISLLNGPRSHFYHLISKERRIFSAFYLSSVFLTLYCSIFVT